MRVRGEPRLSRRATILRWYDHQYEYWGREPGEWIPRTQVTLAFIKHDRMLGGYEWHPEQLWKLCNQLRYEGKLERAYTDGPGKQGELWRPVRSPRGWREASKKENQT